MNAFKFKLLGGKEKKNSEPMLGEESVMKTNRTKKLDTSSYSTSPLGRPKIEIVTESRQIEIGDFRTHKEKVGSHLKGVIANSRNSNVHGGGAMFSSANE